VKNSISGRFGVGGNGGGDAHLDTERCALPLPMHSTSGACREYSLRPRWRRFAPARAGRDTAAARTLPQIFVPDDVPLDVSDDAAKIGLELAQAPVGALELMRMGVALMLDQCQLADPPIGLAQAHPKLLSQAHQPLACPVSLASVGNITAFGCTVVSITTRARSDGFIACVRLATARLS
jgi:hypothetical protein